MGIVWGPDLQLGHRIIDKQHEELVALLNDLDDVIAGRIGSLTDIMRRLETYVVFHFGTEEALMRSLAETVPYIEHCKEHRQFVTQLGGLQDMDTRKPAEIAAGLADYLSNWLREHILVSDRRLVQALKQQAVTDGRLLTR